MSHEIDLSALLDALQVQDATQPKLSFCSGKKASKIAIWADELRSAPVSVVAARLYTCLPELIKLKVDAHVRLEMLEAVRLLAQETIDNLTKEVLSRPINLSKEAQKSIIIGQAIQKRMIDGYARCVADLSQTKRLKPAMMDDLGLSIHRAVTGIGLIFFRSYQLYTQPPVGFWLRLHSLFRIAEYFELQSKPIKDSTLASQASSIQASYLRVLLMATAKLNQVSQNDVLRVYNALETWAQFARLPPKNKRPKDATYIIDSARDTPPVYSTNSDEEYNDTALPVSLTMLVGLLSRHSPTQTDKSPETENLGTTLQIPVGFPPNLLDHLIQCWSTVAKRQQQRRNVETDAEITIGLVNTHFFISGLQTFDQFTGEDNLLNQEIIPSLTREDKSNSAQNKTPQRYRVSIQNISSGGCCLLWRDDAPPKLQAGELIGLKEKNRHIWSVGVIRWIRQFKGSAQVGVQIISSQPKPWGAGQMYDMGGYSDYMRALYVPASEKNQTPATVITANKPFKTQDKVKIFDGDTAFSVKLSEVVFSTSAIQQFSYHPLDVSEKNEKRQLGGIGFEDNWE